MGVRVIVMTVPESPWTAYLQARIPQLEVVMDTTRNHFDTFLASLAHQGEDPALRLEDDIVLTKQFLAKAEAVIAMKPRAVIQFFSMRKDDPTAGSRWDRGFLMNQCCYFPAGYATELLEYAEAWRPAYPDHPSGTDLMVQHWLKGRKEPYWLSVPSLVQHRNTKSRIGARSTYRQSQTFRDPDE